MIKGYTCLCASGTDESRIILEIDSGRGIDLHNFRSYAVEIGSIENKGLSADGTARKLLILGSTA